MIPFNFLNPQPMMGMNLFGAPTMLNDLPEPGMPHTGSADGVTSPLSGSMGGNSLLSDMPALGAKPMQLAGPEGGGFAVPPPPAPQSVDTQNPYARIPPSAASQLPPPRADQGTPGAAPPPPPNFGGLPTMAEGGVGPDVPAASGPATTGTPAPAPAAGGGTNPDGSPKKSAFQDFLEKAGQMEFGGGQQQGGLKPASIGSAGQPHIPQGAAQLFASILEGRQKMMPKIGGVPEIPGVLARLGIGR
jgi:hypothetical protein